MIIETIIFLGLIVILLMAFINFDRLVKIEYRKYKEEWIKDEKPRGFFWRPPESPFVSSSITMQILSIKWLFKTPEWARLDLEAKEYLRRLRLFVLIFNVGTIVWAWIFLSYLS